MVLKKFLGGVKVLAVLCNQFGDTGKGKFSDYFAEHWADVIARGTGGNNAGHTIILNGKEMVFHLLPSGIVHDSKGKINLLGNGMVIDLKVLCSELDELEKENLSYRNLMISKDAHVIMPWHVTRDRARNLSQKDGGIGSTGRGIGPCYADKIARRGVRVKDFFDKEILLKKIRKIKEYYPEQIIDEERIADELGKSFERVKRFVKDTFKEMHKFLEEGKKICIEGAQGFFLSVEHGTYPYVTSSDPSLNGAASGVGISAKDVDLVLGLIKFPFMTRVGAGPFPTELGGKKQEEYCNSDGKNLITELEKYSIPYEKENEKAKYDRNHKKIRELLNSEDEFEKGIGIRLAAEEFGATTGRLRRIGWTDAVLAKYAAKINGKKFVLTKVDSFADAKKFGLCFGYECDGEKIKDFNNDISHKVKPIIKWYKGYGDISGVREFSGLPASLKGAIKDFEDFTDGEVVAVSVGPGREETIVR